LYRVNLELQTHRLAKLGIHFHD